MFKLPIQNLDILYNKITSSFPFLRKSNSLPLLTTEIYETIYPILADYLYQSIEHYNHTITHYTETDYKNRLLKGFTVTDNQTWESFSFTLNYEGSWLLNNFPFKIPTHIKNYNNMVIVNCYECYNLNLKIERNNIFMNNLERLQMEISDIELSHEEIIVYLEENGLQAYTTYNASSKESKRAIYQSALSVLHSIANQPNLMKNMKQDDMSVDSFAKYLQNRINQLEGKIRQMPINDSDGSSYFNLFRN